MVWTKESPLMSSTASLRPRARRTVLRPGPPRRLRRRQDQSHPLMHAFVLVFINTTYWPVLQSCICFAYWKHSWIATPWFVIITPWPPRLMSDFVWTLIAARTLRILYTFQLVLQRKCVCGGRDKSGIFKRKVKTGWMAFRCELPLGVLVPVWQSKEERYPSCHP